MGQSSKGSVGENESPVLHRLGASIEAEREVGEDVRDPAAGDQFGVVTLAGGLFPDFHFTSDDAAMVHIIVI